MFGFLFTGCYAPYSFNRYNPQPHQPDEEVDFRPAEQQPGYVAPRSVQPSGYYGEYDQDGHMKTERIRGYYRSDGTYVEPYYRAPARR